MSDNDPERVRTMIRTAGAKIVLAGVEPIDVAIGMVFAAVDLAPHPHGSTHGALEWLRSAVDVMEDQLLAEVRGG